MITNTTAKITYTFTEGVTEYAVGFVYDTNPDGTPQLKVYKNKLIGTPLVYGTDYTMSLDGTNVVISSGVEVGETFSIIRDIPPVQLSDYTVGRIDPEQIERDMDLAVMRDQQMLAEVDVAISIPADHEERIEAIEDVIPSTATDENKLVTQADIPMTLVSSVNSMIGAVVLDASDVGAATTAQGAKADTAVQPGDLATVATSGSYNDLSGKPTIPTVNNSTITFTQGGVTKGSFSLNQATGDTIALDAGGGGGAVDSVNGKTGVVILTATDVRALPDSTVIPTVNDPTITITQGGVTKGSFSLNQASSGTIALDAGGSGGGDEVIAFQAPTADNNYTWYRKYKSGWVEQGGTLQTAANSLTFPIEMADTNYQWYANPVPQDFGNFRKLAATRATTGLTGLNNIYGTSVSHNSAAVWDAGTFWEVKGMAQA